jgi:hypothetical protein
MGSSSSKTTTTNTNNQTYITDTSVNILNKNTNAAVANALISNKSSCKAVNEITNTMDFSGCSIGSGGINITGGGQKASIVVDFSCLNAFTAEQSMAQSLLSEMVNEIQSKMNANALSNMNTQAETQAKSAGVGFLTGSSKSQTDTNNTFNLKVVNKNNTAIQNVIANSVQANFAVESIQECIADNKIKQELLLRNCKVESGGINIKDFEQVGSVNAVVNCVQQSGTVQKVINDAANSLGVVVETASEVKSSSDITNKIKTTAESVGLGACCDSGASSGIMILVIVGFLALSLFMILKR